MVAIAGVTTLVIAAWKFGGADDDAAGAACPARATAPRTVTHQPVARLTVKAVKGNSLIDVRVLRAPAGSDGSSTTARSSAASPRPSSSKSLWVVVNSPKHVVLSLNGGTPLALNGLCPRSIAVTPQQITSTVACR